MKRVLIFMLCAFVFMNSVRAATLEIGEQYQPKETIVGKISGAVVGNIDESQVKLMRDNVEIAFEFGVEKLGGQYYVWLIAPLEEENYTLVVEDVVTNVGGLTEEENLQKTFSVFGERSEYSIKPGAIAASADFEIQAINNGDSVAVIEIDFPESRTIELTPGTPKEIIFDIGSVEETGLYEISVGNYILPAYIIGSGISENESSAGNESEVPTNGSDINESAEKNYSFEFSSDVIKTSVLKNGELPVLSFEVINIGEEVLRDLKFEYNEARFVINSDEEVEIAPGENFTYFIEIKEFESENYREEIIVYTESYSDNFLVLVEFIEEGEESTDYIEGGEEYYYCSELKGAVCAAGESCSGSEVDSLDGRCCLAVCGTPDAETGGNSWIGYLVAGIGILILIFIFLKYRKSKPSGESAIRNKFNLAEKSLP